MGRSRDVRCRHSAWWLAAFIVGGCIGLSGSVADNGQGMGPPTFQRVRLYNAASKKLTDVRVFDATPATPVQLWANTADIASNTFAFFHDLNRAGVKKLQVNIKVDGDALDKKDGAAFAGSVVTISDPSRFHEILVIVQNSATANKYLVSIAGIHAGDEAGPWNEQVQSDDLLD